MDVFIQELNSEYTLNEYRIKSDTIVFDISSTRKELICPYCGKATDKIHSVYKREIQDLPMQNKKVVLLVDTRKMYCKNKECSHKTFAEQHPFADIKGRKTLRLEKNIIYTSTQLSSVNAEKILKATSIEIGKSSICQLLKKNATHCG